MELELGHGEPLNLHWFLFKTNKGIFV
jgi:hypothetical protein